PLVADNLPYTTLFRSQGAAIVVAAAGDFDSARLNGGFGSTSIDASQFAGETTLVSGLMLDDGSDNNPVIKVGKGDSTVILLGGRDRKSTRLNSSHVSI